MKIKNGTRVTPALLRAFEACWSDERVAEAFRGHPKGVSIQQALRDTSVSLDDRLWLGCKYLHAVDEQASRYFAIEIALTVSHLTLDEDEHLGILNDLLQAEDLQGEEREAARSAARSAASAAWSAASAAWSAARSAVYSAAAYSAENAAWSAASAARSAARSAAWSAAESAAESAARSAARSAAWSAARNAASAAAYSAENAAWSAASAENAAWSAASAAAYSAENAAWSAAMQNAIDRISQWLGGE